LETASGLFPIGDVNPSPVITTRAPFKSIPH
jgi:hypothetical protein